ncbi:hypothetical protein ACHHYP_07007 [Achlya hypogyna]|uniref:Uncharacterized protein n=1 Tax=Achlya hypogyna TaxID=1202772 RepID=A0A1V9YRQ2_ACHHY|nr:hypothetical protein ACHHYP_07007 [Achlya hypogyna]
MNSSGMEYHVMQGSMPDLSTEAGRQLMEQVTAMDEAAAATDDAPYDGRGFFDPSDRLYLVEQAQANREKEEKDKAKEKDAVRSFYKNRRLEETKPRLQDLVVPDLVEKPALPVAPVVVVKKKPLAKKRVAETAVPRATQPTKKLKAPPAIALVGYGSSSDSDEDQDL